MVMVYFYLIFAIGMVTAEMSFIQFKQKKKLNLSLNCAFSCTEQQSYLKTVTIAFGLWGKDHCFISVYDLNFYRMKCF